MPKKDLANVIEPTNVLDSPGQIQPMECLAHACAPNEVPILQLHKTVRGLLPLRIIRFIVSNIGFFGRALRRIWLRRELIDGFLSNNVINMKISQLLNNSIHSLR